MYQLNEDERRFYESQTIPMAIYDYVDGRTVTLLVSEGLCTLKGIDRRDLSQRLTESMFELVHPDDAGRLAQIGQAFAHKEGQYDVVYRTRKDGKKEYHYVHTVGYWQKLHDGKEVAILCYDDLTESGERIQKITEDYFEAQKDYFYKDPVTELPNSNYLHKFAREKINAIHDRGQVAAALFIDMNGMQAYNSKYGYEEGDKLLQLVASSLKTAFPDALVTRGDNDHFILFAADDDIPQKLEWVSREVRTKAKGLTLGFQVGICPMEGKMNGFEAIDHCKHAAKTIQNDLTKLYAYYTSQSNDE